MANIRIEAEQMSLDGFSIENSRASSGGKVINAGNGTGRATTQFNGATGTYSLEVAYHDENDGQSPLSVLVNGQVVASWTANEATNSRAASTENLRKRLISGINLTAGAVIEIRGTTNQGEFARVDYLDIISGPAAAVPAPTNNTPAPATNTTTSSTIGVGRLEAEQMSLSGYQQESSSSSSGGKVVRLNGNNGTASTRFAGASGSYDLVVGYNDENDGRSPVSVKVDGQTVASWTFDEATDSATVSAGNLRRKVISGVSLNANSVIEIQGSLNQNEYARLDYLEVAQSGASVPDPTPDPVNTGGSAGSSTVGVARLEAEQMFLSGYQQENSPNSSGGKVIRLNGERGTAATRFVGSTGSYDLVVAYNDENDGQSPVSVKVDGQTVASWTFSDATDSSVVSAGNLRRKVISGVSLNANSVIEIEGSLNQNEYARLDYLEIAAGGSVTSGPDVPPVNNGSVNTNTNLQAESARVSGANILTGAGSEGGFVDYQNASGDFIEWTVNTPGAGNYELAWRYANGADNRPLELSVNGSVADNSADFNSTGSWYSWGSTKQTVSLAAGTNKVRLRANGSSGANFDYLRVTPTSGTPPTGGGGSGSKLRVLALGDSNTRGHESPGAYRTKFWERAVNDGVAIDFLGTRNNGPSQLGDGDHQGQGGWSIPQMTSWIQQGNLAAQNPDMILFMMGTNDANTNGAVSGAEIRNRLSTLIDEVSRVVPGAHMFVSSILPLDTPLGTAAEAKSARDFNALIPGLVQQKANQGRKVSFVNAGGSLNVGDINGDNSWTSDRNDGLHATASGYDKLGNAWYNGVSQSSVWQNAVNQLGQSGASLVESDQSRDALTGDSQGNVLQSRTGADLITGGLGSDVIVYAAVSDGVDQITDFGGSDRIQISASGFGGDLIAGTTLGGSDYVLGSSAIDGGATFLFDTSRNLLSFDVDGTGSRSAVGLATFSNGFTPQASQFAIV